MTPIGKLRDNIDYFKKVNDTYGHQAGDEVLKQVARIIAKTLRGHDVIGRYGGEEFIIGLVDISREIANQVAERILHCVAEASMTVSQQTLQVTVSIGLSYLGEKDDLHSLIQRADTALYAAKGAGRNCVQVN